VSVGLCIK